jgi:hypothetical protein
MRKEKRERRGGLTVEDTDDEDPVEYVAKDRSDGG